MKNKITIRQARKKDIKSILDLLKEVVEQHCKADKNYKPFSDYKKLDESVAWLLSRRNIKVLVAESGGEIVGYCVGAVEKAPNSLRFKKRGYVDTLVVNKKYRNKGAGKNLTLALMKWFKEKGLKYIELEADTFNVSGVEFWKNRGFSGYRLKMRKILK